MSEDRKASPPWSEEEDRIILAGLEARRSASIIALSLFGRSRNAVIGRISRQQAAGKFPTFPKRRSAPATHPQPRRESRRRGDETPESRPPLSPTQNHRAAAAAVRPEPQPIVRPVCDDAVISVGQGCGILELTHGRCKWPLNSPPRFGTHIYCGDEALPGLPYCRTHTRKAYQPTSAYGRHPPNRRQADD